MSKLWYPVIDYSKCIECGACVDKCPHGVYDKNKDPAPVVVYPEGCIDGCRGCANLCPAGAIDYIGDASGAEGCKCGCDCDNNNGGCC